MTAKYIARRGRRSRAYPAAALFAAVFFALLAIAPWRSDAADGPILRIYDGKTGDVLVEAPAEIGSELFFGWIHSLEKIPWNEYYHVDASCDLILDAITFPAFGAGIPENKGRVCYIENGLIHMEEIDQRFGELVWLNSHTATQEIRLDGTFLTKGSQLPHHARLRLVIERGDADATR